MMLHGGELAKAARDYGIEPYKWLDLSTGVNPNGYPIEDLPKSCFHRLPDPFGLAELEETARECYGVSGRAGLIAAPGSEFLIHALPQLKKQSKIAILSPTFSSHEIAWRRYGHDVKLISRLEEVTDETVVVAANPNNPDGRLIEPKEFVAMADKLRERGGLVVVDEAFSDVAPKTSLVPYVDEENLIVLRSIGKFYGLAGLRLGFAIGANRRLQPLRDLMGEWAVSGPALHVGQRALADKAWQKQTLQVLTRQATAHRDVFKKCSTKVVGGTLLFHLIEVADARTLHHQLAKRAIWTRRFDHDPHWLRVGLCKNPVELKHFETELQEALRAVEMAA